MVFNRTVANYPKQEVVGDGTQNGGGYENWSIRPMIMTEINWEIFLAYGKFEDKDT